MTPPAVVFLCLLCFSLGRWSTVVRRERVVNLQREVAMLRAVGRRWMARAFEHAP